MIRNNLDQGGVYIKNINDNDMVVDINEYICCLGKKKRNQSQINSG